MVVSTYFYAILFLFIAKKSTSRARFTNSSHYQSIMETEFVTFMSENGGPSKGYNSQHITSMDDASSEAPTIVWYLLTIKTFPSIADANHCDEVKHFLWKFIDHSDILIKISTAVLCAENCTVNEAITIIQKIKGVMLQSSQPSMLHMLHCAISKLLMITNESLKEQSNFILSVVEKRWIALFCSIKTDLRNQYKNSHPSARTSVALINVTMVNIFDSLQKINGSVSQVSAKLSGEVLSTWFKALGEYLEVDLPVEEEADQSSLRGDASGAQINIKTLLRAAVLFISANGLGVDGDAPGASKLKERASELFAIGQCIADAVSARISALPLDEIKDALVALIPALSDELYNCLRGESCDMSAVLIALQLSICSHLLVPVEGMLGKKCENAKTPILASAWISEVFGYINWLHSKLVVLSAYQSASGMSSWINCTVSESAAEPGPSSELAHWHSDRHVRFAQYCWMECSELLDCRNLGLLECCSLHMLAASCRAENRGDGSSALNNTCSRKVAVNDNASGFLHSGLSALRPSSMPELRTVFHSPRALPSTELPLLPLCLIGQAIFLSLHQDLNSRTVSSNTHNTGGVLSGFVHTFELLHSLQSLSSQAPTMVLCLLLDAACHLLREKCDEEAAHVPICAYVLQLVECVAATTRLLCLRVPDVLTVVLASPPPLGGSVPITSAATAGAENNSQPSERKKKVTFSLVERIRTHCGSLLGSAVLSHFLCSSSKQGDTEAVRFIINAQIQCIFLNLTFIFR